MACRFTKRVMYILDVQFHHLIVIGGACASSVGLLNMGAGSEKVCEDELLSLSLVMFD